MIMRIERLEIENFKGVKKAEYCFGDETAIYGKNATGKTTIADAFFWLLFDRDSHGNTPGSDKFREKPVDENGQERHYLDTMVAAYCTLDGKPFNLKRVQRENWVTKRGSKDAVYQGNNSFYWINDVETKVTEFKARINSIALGDKFALVARLGAFNALDEKTRRAILIEMANADVDSELLEKEDYKDIGEELTKRGIGIDDLKKILNDQRKKISDEMKLIPAKIDEVNHIIPSLTAEDLHDAELNIAETEKDIENCKTQIAALQAGDALSMAASQGLVKAHNDLIIAKRNVIDEFDSKKRSLDMDVQMAKKRMEAAHLTHETASKIEARAMVDVGMAEQKLLALRKKYKERLDEVFVEGEKPEKCELCGQPISDEVWQESIEQRRVLFNKQKTDDLELIKVEGIEANKQYEAAKKAQMDAKEELEKAEAEMTESSNLYKRTSDTLSAYPKEPNLETEEIKKLEEQIHNLSIRKDMSSEKAVDGLRNRIAQLQERNDRAKDVLAKKAQYDACLKRIAELEYLQTECGKKKAAIEMLVFKIEQFISERSAMLEGSINSKFKTVQWKLFNQQINGGMVDCCECLVPGDGILVPYSGTNTAAKINADIEIIDVLSKFFDIVAPVFVDNAECINHISKPEGQLITMSVSLDDELRCEIKNEEVA